MIVDVANCWVASIGVYNVKSNTVSCRAYIFRASSRDEAHGKALRFAEEAFPNTKGWVYHSSAEIELETFFR